MGIIFSRRSINLLLILIISGVGNLLPPLSARATTVTFSTAGNETWQVPAGVTSIMVKAWGAGGGSGNYGDTGAFGGGGGFVQTTLAVTPLENLTVYVGGGGGAPQAATNNGAGGGGYSAVVRSGTYLVQAGGGGGGAGGNNITGGAGGAGGGINGANGVVGTPGGGGNGGTQYTGGSGGSGGGSGLDGLAGSLNTGGNSGDGGGGGSGGTNGGGTGDDCVCGGGGGGGAGYYGGGAGENGSSGANRSGGGGGGGSSRVTGTSTVNTAGSGSTPGNNTDPDCTGSVGVGATTVRGAGNDGYVVITYTTSQSSAAAWYNASWAHRKKITIDNAMVANSTQTDFPVLVNLGYDPHFAANARSDGYDFLFTSDNGTTKIPYERERYDNATGRLTAWVKVSSLSNSADTTLFVYYGNSGASDQQEATSVWDSNFSAVLHFPEGTGTTSTADATSNNNDGSLSGSPAWISGPIGYGLNYVAASSQHVTIPNPALTSAGTMQGWFYWDSTSNTSASLIRDTTTVTGEGWILAYHSTGDLAYRVADSSITTPVVDVGQYQNDWHHYVVTKNNGNSALYVDGVEKMTGTGAANTAAVMSWRIARNNTTYLTGKSDEVRFSTSARSADWIVTEYNNQKSAEYYLLGDVETATLTARHMRLKGAVRFQGAVRVK